MPDASRHTNEPQSAVVATATLCPEKNGGAIEEDGGGGGGNVDDDDENDVGGDVDEDEDEDDDDEDDQLFSEDSDDDNDGGSEKVAMATATAERQMLPTQRLGPYPDMPPPPVTLPSQPHQQQQQQHQQQQRGKPYGSSEPLRHQYHPNDPRSRGNSAAPIASASVPAAPPRNGHGKAARTACGGGKVDNDGDGDELEEGEEREDNDGDEKGASTTEAAAFVTATTTTTTTTAVAVAKAAVASTNGAAEIVEATEARRMDVEEAADPDADTDADADAKTAKMAKMAEKLKREEKKRKKKKDKKREKKERKKREKERKEGGSLFPTAGTGEALTEKTRDAADVRIDDVMGTEAAEVKRGDFGNGNGDSDDDGDGKNGSKGSGGRGRGRPNDKASASTAAFDSEMDNEKSTEAAKNDAKSPDSPRSRSSSSPPPPPPTRALPRNRTPPPPVDPDALIEYPMADDVVHITEVEWATQEEVESSRYTEKAVRPPFDRVEEPCGCYPDEYRPQMCCVDMTCVMFACQEECRSNCDAGPYCGNKRIQRKEWKKLQVFDANVKGRGLRALERIRKGEFVTEYVGVAIKKRCLDAVFRRYKLERMLYIMSLDDDVYIDARKRGGIARYINHSCEPNCMVDRWKVRGVSRACVFALRDIAIGEELSFDYQWTRKRGRAPTKCHCGSESCRGTLELPKESSLEDEEMDMKLSGHWSPGTIWPGRSIINRTIKVWYEGNQEYFVADVYDYDEKTGKHLIIYKSDLSESWEDLSSENWMQLDEEGEKYVIAKKNRDRPGSAANSALLAPSPLPGSPSPTHIGSGMGNGQGAAAGGGGGGGGGGGDDASHQSQNQPPPPREKFKNYIIVQTPMKEALQARHVLHRCQNRMRVQINTVMCVPRQQQQNQQTMTDEESAAAAAAAAEENRALQESKDGSAWKLVVTGLDPIRAVKFLERNIEFVQQQWAVDGAAAAAAAASSSGKGGGSAGNSGGAGGTGGGAGGGGKGSSYSNSSSAGAIASSSSSSSLLRARDGDGCTTDPSQSSHHHPSARKQEVVIPRCIDQALKSRMSVVRSQCRGVDVNFVHSDSKSKRFAKLVLDASSSATAVADLDRAREIIWKEIDTLCKVAKAPLAPSGWYKDFGFLGGELSNTEFHLVFYGGGGGGGGGGDRLATQQGSGGGGGGGPGSPAAAKGSSPVGVMQSSPISPLMAAAAASASAASAMILQQQDCNENLRETSEFCSSFEGLQRCAVWVQSEEDMGRIDSRNRVVNEASPDRPRKIYFGADPKRVPTLWNLIRTRASDLVRGVRFLNLGPDRIFQPALVSLRVRFSSDDSCDFFDYVKRMTKANVTIDSLAQYHLRIDPGDGGGGGPSKGENGGAEGASCDGDETSRRIALAEELIRLQIEVLRDHSIRKHRWGFGREWALLSQDGADSAGGDGSAMGASVGSSSVGVGAGAARTFSDARAVAQSCMEIAEINSSLELDELVAAHACIILYRFLNRLSAQQLHQSTGPISFSQKLRELSLACLFLANKSQKVKRWKRLEEVLEEAYKIFYPGTTLSGKPEEAAIWERKILTAESEILSVLDYDVFWAGVDWIISAVVKSGGMAEPFAHNAMELALSGPVLAAGPQLWLRLGPEYVFAAVAGFLSIELGYIFVSIPRLIPIKVAQAAEIIASSVRQNVSKKKSSSRKGIGVRGVGQNDIFNGGQLSLLNNFPHVQKACRAWMAGSVKGGNLGGNKGMDWIKQHQSIARRTCCRRVIPGIQPDTMHNCILPIVDAIQRESSCRILFEESLQSSGENLLLEGEWRACTLAEHLLDAAVRNDPADSRESPTSPEDIDDARGNPQVENATEGSNSSVTALVSPSSLSYCSSTAGFAAPPQLPSSSLSSHNLPPAVNLEPGFIAEGGNSVLSSSKAKLLPGVLSVADIDVSVGCWDEVVSNDDDTGASAGTTANCITPDVNMRLCKGSPRLVGGKTSVAGVIPEQALRDAGLRWWIPPRYCPSRTGSMCDCLFVRGSLTKGGNNRAMAGHDHFVALAKLSRDLVGGDTSARTAQFPVLQSYLSVDGDNCNDRKGDFMERRVPVSLQRWPPEKVEARERDFFARKSTDDSSDDGGQGNSAAAMEIGFSAAALQEMQLLRQLHFAVPAPEGHPNFVMPFALAVSDSARTSQKGNKESVAMAASSWEASRDLLALVQSRDLSSLREDAERRKKDENTPSDSHLVFQPAPLVMDRIILLAKKRSPDDKRELPCIPASILACWFHDLLSALAHCHVNHVVLRSIRPDQIIIDRCGVAKLCSFYRAIVLRVDDRGRYLDPVRSAQQHGRKKGRDDELPSNPHMAPEILLGATRETKETDVFALGSLMAQLLLNKPLFNAKTRSRRLEAIFKILGTPSESLGHYPEGAGFPYYEKPKKKYRHGVEKALRFLLKGREINVDEYAGVITLIDKMLHLDPKKRISAHDALEHEVMQQHLRRTDTDNFRKRFVQEWLGLRDSIIKQTETEPDQPNGGAETSESSTQEQKEKKRKKLLMEATKGDGDYDDDLYNLDDVLTPNPSKKAKIGS